MEEKENLFAPNKKSVNLVIVAVTVLSFFVFLVWEKIQTSGNFSGNTVYFLMEHGALYAPFIFVNHEWYRLITYVFLHGGIEHLINNMLILYFMGNAVEKQLGRIRYIILYFCSGILAAIGSIVYNGYVQTGTVSWNAITSVYDYPVCIGASGAIFGVTGTILYVVLVNQGNVLGISKLRILLFVALSIYGGLVDTGVDNAAHIAGVIAGFLLAAILYRKPKKEKTVQEDSIPWYDKSDNEE